MVNQAYPEVIQVSDQSLVPYHQTSQGSSATRRSKNQRRHLPVTSVWDAASSLSTGSLWSWPTNLSLDSSLVQLWCLSLKYGALFPEKSRSSTPTFF